MSHLKRYKSPKNWPINRKGTTFVIRSSFSYNEGLPLTVILRDILTIAKTKREVKKAVHEKNILINNRLARSEKEAYLLFDVLTIVPSKKHYRIEKSLNGKFNIIEISEKDANQKVSKITGKKILKGRKTQLNLFDGRNFLSEMKCSVGDSVVVEFGSEKKDSKIKKCLTLKEKAKVFVFGGKHAGANGVILKIDAESKIAELKVGENKTNVLIKQLMVIEE